MAKTVIEPGEHRWRVIRDLGADESTLEVINDDGVARLKDVDLEMQRKAVEWYSYQNDDFCSAQGETEWLWRFRRKGWDVSTVTRTILSSDSSCFHIHARLDAYEGRKRVYSNNWDFSIEPSDTVYVVKTTEGAHVKLKIKSYDDGKYKIAWKMM